MRLILASLLALAPAPQPGAPSPAHEPKRISARQLSIVTSQSAISVSPGGALLLYVDVTPKPKMHVYAPEQRGGYIRIQLILDDDRLLRPAKPIFPKASDYYFAPLNETFKVYASPFRITQRVALPRTPAMQRRAAAREPLAITGTLRYQACDDEVCYRPQEIKVAWTVGLKPQSLK